MNKFNTSSFDYANTVTVMCKVCGKKEICYSEVIEVGAMLPEPALPPGWNSLKSDGRLGLLVCGDHKISIDIDGKVQELR